MAEPSILADVERFRESRAHEPRDRVANLEPGVLDGAHEPVPRPRPTKREHVPAWTQNAQALGGPQLAPLLEGVTTARRKVEGW